MGDPLLRPRPVVQWMVSDRFFQVFPLLPLSPTGLCQSTHCTYFYVVTCFITTIIRVNIMSYTARGNRGPTRRTNEYFF